MDDPHRVKGSSWVAERDRRLRQETARRLEREQIRARRHIDINGAKVTLCPTAIAEGAYEEERRLRRKRSRRRAPG